MYAYAQDGSSTNNGYFVPSADGSPGQLVMGTWNYTTLNRDGDLDGQLITQLYGYGVSTRLVDAGVDSNALNTLQSAGLGVGWSDFFALMFTQTSAPTANTCGCEHRHLRVGRAGQRPRHTP